MRQVICTHKGLCDDETCEHLVTHLEDETCATSCGYLAGLDGYPSKMVCEEMPIQEAYRILKEKA